MIDWTPAAIEAAHRAMFQEPYDGTTAAMIGAGLDAAAAAQGIKENNALREENARMYKQDEMKWRLLAENTRLREENARLLAALKPFAEKAADVAHDDGSIGGCLCAPALLRSYFFNAAVAIRDSRNCVPEGGEGCVVNRTLI